MITNAQPALKPLFLPNNRPERVPYGPKHAKQAIQSYFKPETLKNYLLLRNDLNLGEFYVKAGLSSSFSPFLCLSVCKQLGVNMWEASMWEQVREAWEAWDRHKWEQVQAMLCLLHSFPLPLQNVHVCYLVGRHFSIFHMRDYILPIQGTGYWQLSRAGIQEVAEFSDFMRFYFDENK